MRAATATPDEHTTMNLFTGNASDEFFVGEVQATLLRAANAYRSAR